VFPACCAAAVTDIAASTIATRNPISRLHIVRLRSARTGFIDWGFPVPYCRAAYVSDKSPKLSNHSADYVRRMLCGVFGEGLVRVWDRIVPRAELPARKLPLKSHGPEEQVDHLIRRMRRRLYPETIPVLASYWLKTVYEAGYPLRWWKELGRLLDAAGRGSSLDKSSVAAITEIQDWVRQTILSNGHEPKPLPRQLKPSRPALPAFKLIQYLIRLLNEWLPAEVARLLISENESAATHDGIPVLSTARALEGLLVRERLSRGTLEAMLAPELASPELFYPRDLELLRDMVLWLLGRTAAPDPPIMPAALFCMVPDSRLPADYGRLVSSASLVRRPSGDEVHVPISASQALEIIEDDPVRIGSMIVTLDGRWWQSSTVQSGEQDSVVYRPLEPFRIDYSADHARLRVPWPENRLRWRGDGHLVDSFRLFGREWRVSKLEAEAEHIWLDLICSRVFPAPELVPAADKDLWSLRPAAVDMAWAAMENALERSVARKNSEPVERLRHADLIPVGRAILQLTESVAGWRPKPTQVIERQLQGLRYLESPIIDEYGRVPWRVLPAPARSALLKLRRDPRLALLDEVIEGLPEEVSRSSQKN
jgi:hypothetical protein